MLYGHQNGDDGDGGSDGSDEGLFLQSIVQRLLTDACELLDCHHQYYRQIDEVFLSIHLVIIIFAIVTDIFMLHIYLISSNLLFVYLFGFVWFAFFFVSSLFHVGF